MDVIHGVVYNLFVYKMSVAYHSSVRNLLLGGSTNRADNFNNHVYV